LCGQDLDRSGTGLPERRKADVTDFWVNSDGAQDQLQESKAVFRGRLCRFYNRELYLQEYAPGEGLYG